MEDFRSGGARAWSSSSHLEPDVLCFTGDLVNDHSDEAEPWISRFKGLTARYGKFSILGNHDYADYARRTDEERENVRRRIREIHGEMGFDLLLDEHRYIERGGNKILIAGVENWGKGFRQSGDLDVALKGAQVDLPTVLLSHDPTHWEERVMGEKAPVDLTLSGHTHGMQMGLEIPALGIKFSPSKLRYSRWGGLYTEGNTASACQPRLWTPRVSRAHRHATRNNRTHLEKGLITFPRPNPSHERRQKGHFFDGQGQ